MTSSQTFDVAVVGEWQLAFVSAACLADAGNRVLLVNPFGKFGTNPECPVREPGIPEMIEKNRKSGSLQFANGISNEWKADRVWMAVDTPVSDKDEPQLGTLLEIAQLTKKFHPNIKSFIVSSQVPLGFCQDLEKILGPKIAYVPENLRLGFGIQTFAQADRTIVGGSSSSICEDVHSIMKNFKTEFHFTNLATSEMVKHANNIFLAMSISFANEIALIGQQFGVDSYFVAEALKKDTRIGPKAYVAPGLGFAGGTLPRDLRVVQALGQTHHIDTPLASAVLKINENTSKLVSSIVLKNLDGVSSPRVLVMGYSYKADTDTLRRSLSVEIVKGLEEKSIQCHGFDPFLNGKDISDFGTKFTHHSDITSIPPVDVVLVMTPRPLFKEIAWNTLKNKDGKAPLVIDAQGFLNPSQIKDAKLRYRKLWSPEA